MTKLLYKRTRCGRIRVTQTHARYANFIRLSTAGGDESGRNEWNDNAALFVVSIFICSILHELYLRRGICAVLSQDVLYVTDRSKSSCTRKLSHQPQLFRAIGNLHKLCLCVITVYTQNYYLTMWIGTMDVFVIVVSTQWQHVCAPHISIFKFLTHFSHDCIIICNLQEN